MELTTYISFCIASFLMALMPGPDNIYVLTESLSKGARNGLWIAFGLNSGVVVHTLLAASGLSLILKESELAFQLLSYLGAAYLFYLAFQAAKEKIEVDLKSSNSTTSDSSLYLYRKGVLMNLLNPKVSLFFIAFLPQFINQSTESLILQALLLGLTFLVIGFITFGSIAIGTSQLRRIFLNQKFLKGMKWLKVIVLIVLAIFLLVP
tara:strand:+ start:782 stop:1402 length:621 start_codon:yes stop_codon:yes gene_type:complete